MQNTKKLLSITNLKKYFPIAKSSIFQREQLYNRANDGITLDIYEGETLGIVGESGCGKSTLGRVLLQLYTQTAGTTLYYGKTITEISPKYVFDTLNHFDKYEHALQKASKKVEEKQKKADEEGGEDKAEFFVLQDLTLAQAEEQTCLSNIVKVVGGFHAYDPDRKGISALKELYSAYRPRNKKAAELNDVELEIGFVKSAASKEGAKANLSTKLQKFEAKKAKLQEELQALEEKVEQAEKKVADIRAEYAQNEEFAKYEAMRDNGVDLARLKYSEMRLLRKDLQIIFQDPYSSLNPRFTIGQIIEEGLLTHKFFKQGNADMRDYIVHVMEECGLQEYMLHRYPHQFSGGQRQRISIARALAVQPKFVVCDECVSALDVSIQSQIINLLQQLREKENLTYMFISHDLSVVRYISDRICVMYLGNVVELSDAKTIFEDPRHPYTVALLSSIPTTDIESLSKERIILEGNIPSPIRPPHGCKFHTRCFMACEKCSRVAPPLREIEPNHFVACHFPEKKMDENGNYLFDVSKTETERKSTRAVD